MRGFSVKVAAAVLLCFVFHLRGSDLVHGVAAEISEGAARSYLMASGKVSSCGRGDVVCEDPKFPCSKTRMRRRLGSRQSPPPPPPILNTNPGRVRPLVREPPPPSAGD